MYYELQPLRIQADTIVLDELSFSVLYYHSC